MKRIKKNLVMIMIMAGLLLVNFLTITRAYADNPYDQEEGSGIPCNEILCRCGGSIMLCCKAQETNVDCRKYHDGCNFC